MALASADDPGALADAASEIAREAGRLLRERARGPRTIARKSSAVDLVTDADRAADDLIRARIRQQFPGHAILTEESGWDSPMADAPCLWIVDPLDGTTNFAHGVPHFAVSIGVAGRAAAGLLPGNRPGLAGSLLAEWELVAGVVHDPMRDELFAAHLGGPALLDGAAIAVSNTRELGASLLATGFPYDRAQHGDAYLAPWKDLLPRARDLRRLGAAALDLAWVGCGRLDGFWEWGLQPWDVAAGGLIVRCAGGLWTDFAGHSPRDSFETLVSNGLIHPPLLEVLGRSAPLRRTVRRS